MVSYSDNSFSVNLARAQTLRALLVLSEIDCGSDRARGFSGRSVSDMTCCYLDILFLKPACSILRQSSNPVCGSWKSQASSLCAKKQSLTWSIKKKPHTGLEDCLRMLFSWFRKRMSGPEVARTREHAPLSPSIMGFTVGVVNFVFVNRLHPLMQSKLTQFTHK